MKNLNKDVVTRDRMIFGSYDKSKYSGGVRHFENLSLETLKRLLEKNFADRAEKQNWAPTIGAIVDFMKTYDGYTAHGYVVEVERGDYRVSLEGVYKDRAADSEEELDEFNLIFGNADDFSDSGQMYCWFD